MSLYKNLSRRTLTLVCVSALMGLTACSGSKPAASIATGMEDFNGFWQPATKVTQLLTLDGKAPPLNEPASKMYEAFKATAAKGERWFDNEEDCLPIGMTRLVAESPFELVIDKNHVAMLFEWNRFVHLAPRKDQHAAEYDYPAYAGYTVARMDGSNLVLDSTYFSSDTLLDYSGLPHSDQLQVVQSLALTDKDTLINTITITDPNAFTAPWQTQVDAQAHAGR
ncbi:MAG: hypothetical protein QM800_06530 [Paludibacter sp.]